MMKFAFYSHKGGVGRTTTAVNTAYQLSKKGKKVCILDLDIEAPGVTLFDSLKPCKFKINSGVINDLDNKDEILAVVKKELENKERPLYNAQIKKNMNKKNEWEIFNENESYIFYLENGKINVISNPLGILEFLNTISNKMADIKVPYSNNPKAFIDEIKKYAPPIERYIYKIRKEDDSNGDIYIMRVFSPWKRKYIEFQGVLHDRIIENYHLFEVLAELIEDTYEIDYILIDSRPGYEKYMQEPLLNTTDGIFICMDLNKKIEKISLNTGKSFADEKKSIRLVVTKYLDSYENDNSHAAKTVERIDSIAKTCKELGMDDTFSTATKIPYYIGAAFDYIMITKEMKNEMLNFNKVYNMYEKVANEMIDLNPDDIITKIKNAVKIDDLNEMKSKFNGLKMNPLYKNDFILYWEYGKQLQKKGQYSDACNELIEAYKLQGSENSDIAYLIGDLFFKIATEKRSEQKNVAIDYVNIKNNFNSAIEYFKEAEQLDYAKKSHLFSNFGLLYFEYYKIFSENVVNSEYLDNAIEYYEKAIGEGLHDPDNYYEMGKILTEKAGILSEKSSEKCKLLIDANKSFKQTVLRKSDETKGRMQWAQNLYEMASITEDYKKKQQYLDKAWELLDELIQKDNEYIEAYYLLGLVQAQLAIYEKRDTRKNLLIRACDNLNKILTHKKDYKKAHFYLGAILFIIRDEMEKEEEIDEKSLYFRDAFYHFEWTVSLHYDLSDFYFKPGEIDTFSTDTYRFVRTLEKLYELNTPSLFKQWILDKEIDPNQQFNVIIEEAIERKKSAINEVK